MSTSLAEKYAKTWAGAMRGLEIQRSGGYVSIFEDGNGYVFCTEEDFEAAKRSWDVVPGEARDDLYSLFCQALDHRYDEHSPLPEQVARDLEGAFPWFDASDFEVQ